jgi:hypothetical protein
MKTINVIIYGCGVMGQGVARALMEKKSLKITGAVDIIKKVPGKDCTTFFLFFQKKI